MGLPLETSHRTITLLIPPEAKYSPFGENAMLLILLENPVSRKISL